MAYLRNLAIGGLCRAGPVNLAAACVTTPATPPGPSPSSGSPSDETDITRERRSLGPDLWSRIGPNGLTCDLGAARRGGDQAGLLGEAALDRATMDPGELAQDCSHWDASLRRLLEGVLQFRGAGSRLTGKAGVDKCLAARVRICGRCRTTQPEHQRQRREY